MATPIQSSQTHLLTTLTIGEEQLPLLIRRNTRAKRICLRYNPSDHALSLTLPRHTRVQDGITFVEKKSDWVWDTLSAQPRKKTLRPGMCVDLLGNRYRLRHDETMRRPFLLEEDALTIGGPREQFAKRLEEAFKKIVRREIELIAHPKARKLGRRINRISVRSTRSRWGSCSSTGNLSFSWRLIFAPRPVLAYVVAHEVAHLVHMDHSKRFWTAVEWICPDHEAPKEWLRLRGRELYQNQIGA